MLELAEAEEELSVAEEIASALTTLAARCRANGAGSYAQRPGR